MNFFRDQPDPQFSSVENTKRVLASDYSQRSDPPIYGDLIMLNVVGDSMINAAIADGDWVVVRRESDVENGDIVAAMIESDTSADGEATVKTFKRSDGHVWLIPHNPAYTPILGDEASILGRVVAVLRRV